MRQSHSVYAIVADIVFFQKEAYVTHHTAGQRNLTLAKEWIRQCLEHHSECYKPRADASFPSRLIDVGSEPGKLEPRLVLTANITSAAPPRYTTPSHCWGKLDIQAHAAMTTTRDTLKSRLEEIPLAGLPRSFQDAIKATRDLGIPYVWIDSLYIIQTGWGRADAEAGEDWIRESSKMGAIYRNSECCLIATASPDAHGGFFVEKVQLPPVVLNHEDYEPLGIGDPPQSSRSPSWNCGFTSEKTFVATLDAMANSGTVSKRGWCLQERYLSPRALYFTKHGLVWECHAVVNFDQPLRSGDRPNLQQALEREGEAKFFGRALDRWDAIMADFSSRALTQASDRLPAVAGLAQEVAHATGATYLAGLWDHNVLRWLCWNVDEDWLSGAGGSASASARPEDYYAPSWSWGCLHGTPVKFPSTLKSIKSEDFAAKVEAVNILPGRFEYGPPRAGSIVLTGPFRRISVHWEDEILWVDGANGRAEEVGSLVLDRLDEIPRHGKHTLHTICLWSFQDIAGGGLALKEVAGATAFRRVG
ncbi:hypothetical protein B0H63DRAFT_393747 [Podospora didyma]|uniref:Heterokaryon incompatibility domain-containing protein n=1 Tax=Podospora didyma TaxID=330526 RepID=A0AAE0NQH9_9PEZI|nr:hypothetical protein B0H63DRAFT_393747 [Podospora didyma]